MLFNHARAIVWAQIRSLINFYGAWQYGHARLHAGDVGPLVWIARLRRRDRLARRVRPPPASHAPPDRRLGALLHVPLLAGGADISRFHRGRHRPQADHGLSGFAARAVHPRGRAAAHHRRRHAADPHWRLRGVSPESGSAVGEAARLSAVDCLQSAPRHGPPRPARAAAGPPARPRDRSCSGSC